jgi:hypothetical protein
MKRHYQTWFGVKVPEWRGEKFGSGATTIRFVLTGKIISKKNNVQAIAVRKPALDWLDKIFLEKGHITIADAKKAVNIVRGKVIGNTEYKDFLKKFKPVIQEQAAHWAARLGEKGLIFPVQKSTCNIRLYFKDKYLSDAGNKQETIHDLLKEAGVIVDDNRMALNPIRTESADYYQQLADNIAFISLSFRLHRHIPLV